MKLPRSFSPALVLTLVLLGATAVAMAVLPRYMNVYLFKLEAPSRKHMREVSRALPSWQQVGQDREQAAEVLKTLGTENTITRLYVERNPPKGQSPLVVELHLAFYTGMVDTVPHVSDRCMVGGGWQPLSGSTVTSVSLDDSGWRRADWVKDARAVAECISEARLPVDPQVSSAPGSRVLLPYGLIASDPRDARHATSVPMRISDFVDPKTQAVSIIGHFFIANNQLTPSADSVRELAFRLTDDYAYYVKVQISVTAGLAGDARERRVADAKDLARIAGGPGGFISELLPEVMLCLPDWIELERKSKAAHERGSAPGGKAPASPP